MTPSPILARALLVLAAAFIPGYFVLQAITPSYSFLGSALTDHSTMRPAHASVWLRERR